MHRAEFQVATIDCQNGARTITQALEPIPRISTVEVDVRTRRERVQYGADRLDQAQLRDILEGSGFAVEP